MKEPIELARDFVSLVEGLKIERMMSVGDEEKLAVCRELLRMRADWDRASDYLIGRVTCPCCEQTRQCVPDCTFAEDCWDAHCEMELARTALYGPKES